MNLPGYFIADLPGGAEVTPTLVRQACETIRRNRDQYLASRSVHSVIELLAEVARSWLDPNNRFRKLALEHGSDSTGFSAPTISEGIDSFFKEVTAANLEALLEQDFGNAGRLERMVATSPEDKTGRAGIVTAPHLIAHITAGNLPCGAWQSMLLSVLLRSAQFVKCGSGASLLPRLLAHSLYEADNKLGSAIEVAEWPGGSSAIEEVLFGEADCVTVSGSDETIGKVREKMPAGKRLVAYGHRLSFGYISKGVLSGLNVRKIVAKAAQDVVAWDQLGCLSPHAIYVEEGAELGGEQFAEKLAEELAELEISRPRGRAPQEIAAAIAARRGFYEVRAAHSLRSAETLPTRLWCSPGSTAWTVVYEADALFQPSCLHRFIYVKSVSSLDEVLRHADAIRGNVSTVGLAAPEEKAEALATQLSRWGIPRICPLGQMQNPPVTWRHDGRPPLGELVQWSDWEM